MTFGPGALDQPRRCVRDILARLHLDGPAARSAICVRITPMMTTVNPTIRMDVNGRVIAPAVAKWSIVAEEMSWAVTAQL